MRVTGWPLVPLDETYTIGVYCVITSTLVIVEVTTLVLWNVIVSTPFPVVISRVVTFTVL